MCECGCSMNYHTFSLPGPNGTTYVLEFGPGCPDCETPAGVIVSVRNTADVASHYGEFPPELPMHPLTSLGDNAQLEVGIGVANPHSIHQFVVAKISEAFGVEDCLDWPENFNLDPDELKEELYEKFSNSLATSIDALGGIA